MNQLQSEKTEEYYENNYSFHLSLSIFLKLHLSYIINNEKYYNLPYVRDKIKLLARLQLLDSFQMNKHFLLPGAHFGRYLYLLFISLLSVL